MKISFRNLALAFIVLGAVTFTITLLWILKEPDNFGWWWPLDLQKAAQVGAFLTGISGVIWSAAGVFLIFATFEKQRQLTEKEHFQTSFFNLLNNFQHYIDNMEESNRKEKRPFLGHEEFTIYRGRELLSVIHDQFIHSIHSDNFILALAQQPDIPESLRFMDDWQLAHENKPVTWGLIGPVFKDFLGQINKEIKEKGRKGLSWGAVCFRYEFVYDLYHSSLEHYFRLLVGLIKFVVYQRKDRGEVKQFLDLLCSQLSQAELGLLFYHAHSKYGKNLKGEPELFEWLEKYQFFKHLDKDTLMAPWHAKFYQNTKFQFPRSDEKDAGNKAS